MIPIFARPPIIFCTLAMIAGGLLQSAEALAAGPVLRPGEPYPNSALHWPASAAYDVPPKLVRGNAPLYPITQAWSGKPGLAIVAFTVGPDGATRDIQVVRATYPYFASHTVLAVRDWKFDPARKKGRPVPVRIRLTMPFGLRS
jgi:TonB family protein